MSKIFKNIGNIRNVKNIPKVLGGMGLTLISTSSGIMVDREARKRNIGGEILCRIW